MSAVRKILTEGELEEFLGEREFSVIHLDAEWDGRRAVVERKMIELAGKTGESTAFGYIDVDVLQHHARGIQLKNVPACSYYRGRERVGTVMGANQDIEGCLQRVREGGVLEGQGVIGPERGEVRPPKEFNYTTRNFLGALQLLTVFGLWALLWLFVMTKEGGCYGPGGPPDLSLPLCYFGWLLVLVPIEWMNMMKRGERRDPRWASRQWPKVSGVLILILLVAIFGAGFVTAR